MTFSKRTYQRLAVLLPLVAAVGSVLVGTLVAVFTSIAPQSAPRLASALETYGDDGFELGFQGFAGRVPDTKKPKLTAYFTCESYRPGESARLIVTDTAPAVTVRFYRAGGEDRVTVANDVMYGTPVGRPVAIGAVNGRREIRFGIGSWPSGVYFAQLTSGDRVGYAPFVLAPRRLGEHPVAVVMPTETWQAYNFRDDDGDGHGDTWYAGWRTNKARLIRPFLNRGVPPHWKQYDAPFVRWLTHTGRAVDYLSDAELRTVASGRGLAGAYRLIVFSGHHEYVTTHEYDVVESYRHLGGNLAFLSANNFFWKIDLHDDVMTRVAQWRNLGRPEASLIGVQYRANDNGSHRGPWIVRKSAAPAAWLLDGTELGVGDGIGSGGIEIDQTAPSSPKGTTVIAEIPNLYGPGFTAQMTYYETAAGAKVFAAGAFTLAGSCWEPQVEQLLENLWKRLTVA
jgi:hypothetical protein